MDMLQQHIHCCALTLNSSLAQHEFWEKFVHKTCRTDSNLLDFLEHVAAT